MAGRAGAALTLQLRPWQRWACVALEVLPVPGVGGIVAGWRNPHTTLRRNGAFQATLVVAGWPLVVPAVVGVAWAVVDAVRVAKANLVPLPPRSAAPLKGS